LKFNIFVAFAKRFQLSNSFNYVCKKVSEMYLDIQGTAIMEAEIPYSSGKPGIM